MTLTIENTTQSMTVNPAFLREIKDENQHLAELLKLARHFVESPRTARFKERVFARLLGELRDQLAMHFTLEEAYGYFDNALDVDPCLAVRAESLRSEHSSLYAQLRDLADAAEDSVNGQIDSRKFFQIVVRFRQFDDQLNEHEQNETHLILDAFDTDVGVGD